MISSGSPVRQLHTDDVRQLHCGTATDDVRQLHCRTVRILMVEDNPGDVRLAREALREGMVDSELTVAPDGIQALAALRGEGARPDLILLDLNLPGRPGREVLAAIKGDPLLREIPVVIFTSSCAEEEVRAAYRLQANCYVTKPVDLDRYLETVRAIQDFWFSVARLPAREPV